MYTFFLTLGLLSFAIGLFSLLAFLPLLMETLRVGSLNINGARDAGKMSVLGEYVKQKKVQVLFLQETHSDVLNEVDWGLWWKGASVLSHGTNLSAGVAVLFAPGLSVKMCSSKEVCRGRLLVVKAEINNMGFVFINVYAPNTGRERGVLFGSLRQELSQVAPEETLVAGGDWNCTMDFTKDRNGEEPHSVSVGVLRDIINQFDLVDVWRTKHPNTRQYTWVKVFGARVSAARLDRFYMSRNRSNRLLGATILPVGFSDHHITMARLSISPGPRQASYWKFNVKLLQDATFCAGFQTFWERWRQQIEEYESLSQWWDVGKVQIRLFCQQYTALSSSVLGELERCISEMEVEMVGQGNVGLQANLAELRRDLGSFFQVKAKGALVRARFSMLKEMDAPSSFFFGLERQSSEAKGMHCLRLSDGRVTSVVGEMRERTVEFYTELYRAEECDPLCAQVLFTELPKLSLAQRDDLDVPLLSHELAEAVTQMSPGRAPGVDGLPVEFSKKFWGIIGQDFFCVLRECVGVGELPMSCRRAALTLLPKKGDLCELKNWRPVALLCADYKIFAKVLSNRLKSHLDSIVHKDQTYCVPGRSITDNLFLIRDMLDLSRGSNVNFGLVSLDQEKAFDRVDHEYLFNVMSVFGFGRSFLTCVKLLYAGASCMVKVGGGLSRPVWVRRGIRQGCPLFGQLYTLAIEPFLGLLRRRLQGVCWTGMGVVTGIAVSAYADDVSVMVRDGQDMQALETSLKVYEGASSAKVNWGKSKALLCGAWGDRAPPLLPGGLQWGCEGLKVLGVYLGSERWVRKNWEGLSQAVVSRLARWRWLLSQVSYRGRVLIINNLVASSLWHKLAVLNPPAGLLADLQRKLVDFFWSGHHWLRAAVLYMTVHEGGQGLVELESRMAAFRLKAAQRLLYHTDVGWREPACALLRRAGDLGLDRQLFLMKLERLSTAGLSDFYSAVLRAWQLLRHTREGGVEPGLWVWEEPIFHNPAIPLRSVQSATLQRQLMAGGVKRLGDLRLLGEEGWKSPEVLAQQTGITSLRLLERFLEEVQEALSEPVRGMFEQPKGEGPPMIPPLQVTAETGDWQGGLEDLLDFNTPSLGEFEGVGGKALYNLCVKVRNIRSLTGVKAHQWQGVCGVESMVGFRWRGLYKPPVPKRSGDLQWRVLHGALATNSWLARVEPGVGQECHFCKMKETVIHVFSVCTRLMPLMSLLECLCERLGVVFTVGVFIMGYRYSSKEKEKCVLLNFLFAQAKLAIWLTRRNRVKGGGITDPLLLFNGMVSARLRVEFEFYKMIKSVEMFQEIWCVGGAVCIAGEDVLDIRL